MTDEVTTLILPWMTLIWWRWFHTDFWLLNYLATLFFKGPYSMY